MMKPVDMQMLADVQGARDERHLAIQRVGVRRLRYPILWAAETGPQPTVAEFSLSVHLPAEKKGTHMSRFVAMLEGHAAAWSLADAPAVGKALCERLEAGEAEFELKFPLFIKKTAPVSGVQSMLDYEVVMRCVAWPDMADVAVQVTIPVTSLCPCSKEISEYGAHNQRSHIVVTAHLDQTQTGASIESLIRLVESQASSELYGLLKRPDEKFVTERAYDNPKFVEDLVRDIAIALRAQPWLSKVRIEAENFESIHNHSAWAVIEL
jgi:GTP cyclohydrolase I